jgi:hypothetical protein
MIAFIAGLLLWIAALLGGMFAVSLNNKGHWLPQQLDNSLVAFLCGSVVAYWLAKSAIEGLEDFIAWLKGPTPLEQSREKIVSKPRSLNEVTPATPLNSITSCWPTAPRR